MTDPWFDAEEWAQRTVSPPPPSIEPPIFVENIEEDEEDEDEEDEDDDEEEDTMDEETQDGVFDQEVLLDISKFDFNLPPLCVGTETSTSLVSSHKQTK